MLGMTLVAIPLERRVQTATGFDGVAQIRMIVTIEAVAVAYTLAEVVAFVAATAVVEFLVSLAQGSGR